MSGDGRKSNIIIVIHVQTRRLIHLTLTVLVRQCHVQCPFLTLLQAVSGPITVSVVWNRGHEVPLPGIVSGTI